MTRIAIYDTTLRDGSQGEGVNFSLQDKLTLGLTLLRIRRLELDFMRRLVLEQCAQEEQNGLKIPWHQS